MCMCFNLFASKNKQINKQTNKPQQTNKHKKKIRDCCLSFQFESTCLSFIVYDNEYFIKYLKKKKRNMLGLSVQFF